jgi:hypothetical protein
MLKPQPAIRSTCSFGLLAVKFLEYFEFEVAQFAVGDDEKVSAAARGIEETEGAKFLVKFFETFASRAGRGSVRSIR